ncbi:hypothetical protein ACH47Z_18700 [Streptomyces sp. NPDC020192]|uniref:hypothetical protein n=1 Tax=Streptomyces sp. NPDC020192 TaxID=3365066 RepID=UPI0037906B62
MGPAQVGERGCADDGDGRHDGGADIVITEPVSPLEHGQLYQVCVSVQEQDGPKPVVASRNVKGRELGIIYT